MNIQTSTRIASTCILSQNHLKKPANELIKHSMYTHYLDLFMSNRSSQPLLLGPFPQIGPAVAAFLPAEAADTEVPARAISVIFEKKLRVSRNPIVSESQNQRESNSKRKSQSQSLSQKQGQSLSQCSKATWSS